MKKINNKFKHGKKIHNFCAKIFFINRSITGPGVRQTLKELKNICTNLKLKSYPSNLKVFDWKIPLEWQIKDAFIISPNGKKLCEFKKNNLHVVGYSSPIKKVLSLNTLKKKLHSIKKLPNAIPYITTYYKKDWGFCITENEKKKLKSGKYKVVIDSKFIKGNLNFGEIILKGKSKKEIFLSTNICHPSLANNELSGPSVLIFLANWLSSRKNKYTYRIVFLPETIGSIAYLFHKKEELKLNVIAGFNVVCVGDDRTYSYVPSRNGNSLSDKVALSVLKSKNLNFKKYKWSDRGSDERQYCSPNIDLPIASLCRSKYGEYKEYHNSLDDLKKVVTPKGLDESFKLLKETIIKIEKSVYPKATYPCEPMLSKRNLYATKFNQKLTIIQKNIREFLSYADGTNSIDDFTDLLQLKKKEILHIIDILKKNKLIKLNLFYEKN